MNLKKTKAILLDLITDVVVVAILVLIIRTFVYAPFRVDGPSMCDTFNNYDGQCLHGKGELILTSRFATWDVLGFSFSEINRGDVIVFEAPYSKNKEYYIKRVIGLPGDTVRIEDGLVYLEVDGEFVELEEGYLNEDNQGDTQPYQDDAMTYEVPEDNYFVLGDNRKVSSDSRRCFRGSGCSGSQSSHFLPFEFIEGEVKSVIFPFDHMRWVDGYDYSL